MRKAFLYRRGGLGDTLTIFPVFEILKNEGFHITASGNRDYLMLAYKIGWIDKIVSEMPDEPYDVKAVIGINGNIYPFPGIREWIVQYYLKHIGLNGKKFSKILPLERIAKYRDIDTSELSIFVDKVLIHPSSGSLKKNLPPALFMILRELFPEALFIAGEADGWLSDYIKPFYFDNDIVKTALLLKRARLFIGADSGLSHLSAYLGVKTVVIYGPSDPVIWRPVGERIIQIRPSDCNPCFPHVCEERRCLNYRELIDKVISQISKELM